MEKRFWPAMGALAVLAMLAAATLSGPIRTVTLVFLGGLAAKTWIALLRDRQERADEETHPEAGVDTRNATRQD